MTNRKLNQKSSDQQLQSLIDNLQDVSSKTVFTIASKSYKASDLVSFAKSLLSARAAVTSAHAAVKAALKADLQAETTTGAIVAAARSMLVGMYSDDDTKLSALGVSARKPARALTSEQQVVAQAKRTSTRKARGTMGKRQKAAIVGSVTGVNITPVMAPQGAGSTPVSTTTPDPTAQPPSATVAAASAISLPQPNLQPLTNGAANPATTVVTVGGGLGH